MYVVDGSESRVMLTSVVPEPWTTELITGQFCWWFGPPSLSAESFGSVTEPPLRLMFFTPLPVIVPYWIELLVDRPVISTPFWPLPTMSLSKSWLKLPYWKH